MRQTTHFKYKMEDVECKFCTEYRGKKRGCAHAVCPWLAERIEAVIGAPAQAQRSGSRGERRSSGMSELCRCPLRRSEGYGACDDDGYEEALLDSFPHDPELEAKLHTAVQLFHGSLWLDEAHRQRMEALRAREGSDRRRDTPAYLAAMYLLTSEQDTAKRTANLSLNSASHLPSRSTAGGRTGGVGVAPPELQDL